MSSRERIDTDQDAVIQTTNAIELRQAGVLGGTMIHGSEQVLPPARTDRLLIERLPDETLVYDLDRQKAHCLNQTAALIWKHCDGKTTIRDVTLILQEQFGPKVKQEVVLFGLDQLQRARLIDRSSIRSSSKPGFSRRELIKKIGLAASVPLIVSVIAPTASAAASCVNVNCVGNAAICGANCTCNGTVCV
jgi:Coenzyme PQQ synthesis protein D (PqqD)